MSQTIRQQIAQKQAELAELERQALLAEKVETFQTFRDLYKANPTFHKIISVRDNIVEKTLFYREQHPEYIDGDWYEVIKIHGQEKDNTEIFDRDCPFRPELITEPYDLLLATETDEVAKEILEKSKVKALSGYTAFVEKQNAPSPPSKPFVVPDVSKKGKKGK
jgi:hypothetical protein